MCVHLHKRGHRGYHTLFADDLMRRKWKKGLWLLFKMVLFLLYFSSPLLLLHDVSHFSSYQLSPPIQSKHHLHPVFVEITREKSIVQKGKNVKEKEVKMVDKRMMKETYGRVDKRDEDFWRTVANVIKWLRMRKPNSLDRVSGITQNPHRSTLQSTGFIFALSLSQENEFSYPIEEAKCVVIEKRNGLSTMKRVAQMETVIFIHHSFPSPFI